MDNLVKRMGTAMEHSSNVTLALADASTFDAFKQELKASFSVAVEEAFGAVEPGLIPSDDDIDQSLTAPRFTATYNLGSGSRKLFDGGGQ